jgi:ubiquinone/menaquinone biosynthesis C-methylase UbiE
LLLFHNTAVRTWSLCMIPDPLRALCEVRRVLRAEGELLFVEHGRAPEPTAAFQFSLKILPDDLYARIVVIASNLEP